MVIFTSIDSKLLSPVPCHNLVVIILALQPLDFLVKFLDLNAARAQLYLQVLRAVVRIRYNLVPLQLQATLFVQNQLKRTCFQVLSNVLFNDPFVALFVRALLQDKVASNVDVLLVVFISNLLWAVLVFALQ